MCFNSVSSQHGALDALCELYYEFHMHNIMYVIRVSLVVALSYNLVFQNSNAWYAGHLKLCLQCSSFFVHSSVEQMAVPSSISQCIRSHVVLFDMNMCYLTWAGLAAAHTNLHEENLHHFFDDS